MDAISGLTHEDFGFGKLFNVTREAVIVGDARSGRIVLWNPAAERLFGYKAEDALNMKIHDLVPEQFRGAHLAGLERYNRTASGDLIDSGTVVELPGLHKNGKLMDLEFVLSSLGHTDEAETPFVLATMRDITFRQVAIDLRSEEQDAEDLRSEEHVAESGRANDLLRKTTNDLLRKTAFITLLQNVAIAANEATDVEQVFQNALEEICKLTGWPVGHAQLVGRDGNLTPTVAWYDIQPALTAPFKEETMNLYGIKPYGQLAETIATRQPRWIADVTSDETFLRKKTAVKAGLMSAFAFPLLVGEEIVGILEFFSSRSLEPDEEMLQVMGPVGAQLGRVIERHRAAVQLQEKEDRLYRFMENLPVGVFVLDSAGIPLYSNAMSQKLTGMPNYSSGLPESELKNYPAVVAGTDEPYPTDAMPVIRALAGEAISVDDMEILHSSGRIRLRVTGLPIRDSQGHINFALAAFTDITESKAAELQLLR
ncbi:MAG: PAS domain S-box protein, partial [Actinobacteria bacterium]|nr:PAS domain S-box protein [Actinomycetota bacterium]